MKRRGVWHCIGTMALGYGWTVRESLAAQFLAFTFHVHVDVHGGIRQGTKLLHMPVVATPAHRLSLSPDDTSACPRLLSLMARHDKAAHARHVIRHNVKAMRIPQLLHLAYPRQHPRVPDDLPHPLSIALATGSELQHQPASW